jgi:hypothetical protein
MSIVLQGSGAIFPGIFERTLADLEIGESVYTIPWALIIDDANRCYLDGTCSFKSVAHAAYEQHVERVEEGYLVTLVPKYAYIRTPVLPHTITETDLIPVLQFV